MAAVNVSQKNQSVREATPPQDGLMRESDLPSVQSVDQLMIDCLAGMRATPARDAATYHLQTGGHRMRAKLALASSAAGQMDAGDSAAVAAACELLHNASLVHDDIADGDQYRRGHRSVRALYGDDIALCAGDLLMSAAFQMTARVQTPLIAQRLTGVMADTATRVIGGQSVELAGRDGSPDIGTLDYLSATRQKTAPLIELAINAGVIHRDDGPYTLEDGRRLAEAIGLAYQILDDLDDLKIVNRPEALHPLHAWWHHRSGARCLGHVRAALGRATRLADRLPEPLAGNVFELIQRLSAQSQATSGQSLTHHKG